MSIRLCAMSIRLCARRPIGLTILWTLRVHGLWTSAGHRQDAGNQQTSINGVRRNTLGAAQMSSHFKTGETTGEMLLSVSC